MMNAVRPGEQPAEASLDAPLGADVDGGGRLVEDEDARIGEERAGERDELALAEREPEAALADFGVVALRELRDERIGADGRRRGFDLRSRCARAAEGDVVRDRAREEEPLLRDDPELPPERGLRDVAEIGPVDRDSSVARVVEAREQLRDGRLPGSRVADERDGRPHRDVEVEVVEDVRELAVAEAHMLEADVSLDAPEAVARWASRRGRAPRRGRR